jgi:hypothetical protein
VSRCGWQSEEEGLCDFRASSKEQILGGHGGGEVRVTGERGRGAGTVDAFIAAERLRDFRAGERGRGGGERGMVIYIYILKYMG